MNKNDFIAMKFLYFKEVYRFLKVYNQTLLAPVVNSLLLLSVITLAVSGRNYIVNGVEFKLFALSGLAIVTSIQGAFACSSSVFTMSKVLGHITDYLIPPLKTHVIIISMTLAATTRGLIIATLLLLVGKIFIDFNIQDPAKLIIYLLISCTLLSLIGIMGGLIANSFDQMSAINSYIITPLTLLSGTFYSTKQLSGIWYDISMMSPFLYMVNGFRSAIIGVSDIANEQYGINYILILIAVMYIATHLMIKTGYKIKQ